MKKKVSIYIVLSFFILLQSCYSGYFVADRQYKSAIQQAPYDVIIVPGFPYQEGEQGYTLLSRILWADYLYKNGHAKHIVFSGAAVYTPHYEAEIMRLYALELGIPSDIIHTENEARHGVENLYYSYLMAIENDWQKIAIATDNAQVLTIAPYGKPLSNKVAFLPMIMDEIKDADLAFLQSVNINDSIAFKENFTSYTETSNALQRLLRSSGRDGLKRKMRKLLKSQKTLKAHKS
ncbi:MAG: YdcF family protein [Chitinophagales bacterium]